MMPNSTHCRALSAAFLVAVMIVVGPLSEGRADPLEETLVTVDLGKKTAKVKSMSGFLMSLNATRPPDGRIEPLRPALWRLSGADWRSDGTTTIPLQIADRLVKLKIPTIVIELRNTWYYSHAYRQWPYTDYAVWEEHVRRAARDAKAKDLNVVWDIWNEPDSSLFWKGTREQFCETFVRAAKVLRHELDERAIISGPSLAQYDPQYLTEFLDYCKQRRIRVDVLSWHEFVDHDIPSITERLRQARRSFVENRAYKNLGIKKIHINEIIGQPSQYRPGEILGYFHALEEGNADGACKACWSDSTDLTKWRNCSNETLDGVLTPQSFEPRAAWWAYKHYSDSVSSRVESRSSNVRVVSFASRGESDAASPQVLFGYFGYQKSPSKIGIRLRLKNLGTAPALAKTKQLRVRIERIPDSGEQPLPRLQVVAEDTLTVASGVAQTKVFNALLHEAYVLTLLKP